MGRWVGCRELHADLASLPRRVNQGCGVRDRGGSADFQRRVIINRKWGWELDEGAGGHGSEGVGSQNGWWGFSVPKAEVGLGSWTRWGSGVASGVYWVGEVSILSSGRMFRCRAGVGAERLVQDLGGEARTPGDCSGHSGGARQGDLGAGSSAVRNGEDPLPKEQAGTLQPERCTCKASDMAAFSETRSFAGGLEVVVKLVGGRSPCAGVLGLEHFNQTLTSCDPQSVEAGTVFCKELGCGSMLQAPSPPPETEGPRKGQQFVVCEGSEPAVLNCKINWANFKPCVSHGEVICSGKKAAS